MTNTVTSLVRVAAVLIAGLGLWAGPARAQDVTADVRTWSGQAWRLAQPSMEVFYTIPAPPKGAPGATDASYGTPAPGASSGGSQNSLGMTGSFQDLKSFFDQGPGPRQGHRQADYITLRRGDVETQVPLASIASLTFTRQPARSTLPPYIVNRHFRYAATAVLMDGSRIEADYVNLGTLVLRGQTPQGRLDLSWEDIQSLSFQR